MLIGVGIDPGESESRISGWAERNSFFWPLAPVSADPVRDYRISQQSAAVGIDALGEIVLRKNGGLQGEDKWRDWLDTLGGPRSSAAVTAPSTDASLSGTLPTSGVIEAQPTIALAPTAAPAPTTAPVAAAPTAVTAPTDAPAPVVAPAPTITPSPIPTATPRPAPTATPRPTATPVPPTATPNVPVGHNVGQRAPDFTVTAVNGETVTLSEVTASGKAVIVYFFATW